jgi:hypothetical protein
VWKCQYLTQETESWRYNYVWSGENVITWFKKLSHGGITITFGLEEMTLIQETESWLKTITSSVEELPLPD